MKVPAWLRGQRGLEAARKGSLSQFTQSTWEREVPGCSPRPRNRRPTPSDTLPAAPKASFPPSPWPLPLGSSPGSLCQAL